MHGRWSLLFDENGDFDDAEIRACGANDEFAREDVAVDDAAFENGQERFAAERLRPMRIGSAEADEEAEEHRVDEGAASAKKRPAIARATGDFRADHQVGGVLFEQGGGARVKIQVAEVDFVAKDEPAPRAGDSTLERRAVIRFFDTDDADGR